MAKKINSATLRAARRARKLTVSEVADFTKISAKRLRAFEAGEASPSIGQVSKFESLYNVPFYQFYGDDQPVLEEVIPDFRKSSPKEADLSPKGLSRIWQVENRVKFVDMLLKALGRKAPKTTTLRRMTNKDVIQPMVFRAKFDDWLQDKSNSLKFTGTREDVFSRHLRLYLEIHACHTVVNTAPVDDYLGFYISHSSKSNVIFVNRDVRNEKRRLFTLSHELAHFAYDAEGISNPFVAKNDIERQCNAFAAEFLAPDEQITRIVRGFSGSTTNDIGRLVDAIASSTLLSRQAATLRLRDLDLVSNRLASEHLGHLSRLRRLDEPRADNATKPIMGRNAAVAAKLSQVGVYAAYTASLAIQQNLIDQVDVTRGLGISESLQKDVLRLAVKRFEASAI